MEQWCGMFHYDKTNKICTPAKFTCMEEWFKFCEEKTATISVSSSASCDVDSLTVIDINIDTRKMKPCPKVEGDLLYSEEGYKYYKVPVADGHQLVEGKVVETCTEAG